MDCHSGQFYTRIVDSNGIAFMETRTVLQTLNQRWRRLARWPRRLLVMGAVLVGVAWITIGSVVLLALADSPFGCPPTMGCRETQTNDCPPWSAFTHPASTRAVCDGGR